MGLKRTREVFCGSQRRTIVSVCIQARTFLQFPAMQSRCVSQVLTDWTCFVPSPKTSHVKSQNDVAVHHKHLSMRLDQREPLLRHVRFCQKVWHLFVHLVEPIRWVFAQCLCSRDMVCVMWTPGVPICHYEHVNEPQQMQDSASTMCPCFSFSCI